MHHKKWISLTVSFAFSLTTLAMGADKGFYLTGAVGAAEERPGKSDGIDISIGFPPIPSGIVHVDPDRVTTDGGDTGWGIGVGYRFSRYFAAELDYTDFGENFVTEHYSFDELEVTLPDTLELSYRSSVSGPAVSALGILPLGKGFEVYLRAGALFSDREMVSGPTRLEGNSLTFGETVWLAGAGVDWAFAGRWGLRAEYQRSGEINNSAFGIDSAIEWLSLRLRFDF